MGHPELNERAARVDSNLAVIERQAKEAKYHIEFAMMMLNCGRFEEANKAFPKAIEEAESIEAMAALMQIKTEVFG